MVRETYRLAAACLRRRHALMPVIRLQRHHVPSPTMPSRPLFAEFGQQRWAEGPAEVSVARVVKGRMTDTWHTHQGLPQQVLLLPRQHCVWGSPKFLPRVKWESVIWREGERRRKTREGVCQGHMENEVRVMKIDITKSWRQPPCVGPQGGGGRRWVGWGSTRK